MTNTFVHFRYSTYAQTNICILCCYYDVYRGILPAIDVLGDNALVGVRFNCTYINFYINATSFLDNTVVGYNYSVPEGIHSPIIISP